jgi:heme A synthase
MKVDRFSKYAWGVLAFNLAVIMFGAYVRASSSGAGCGAHWPLCNGEIIPRAPRIETLIEFTHRTTSGLAFLLVTGLLFFAWRAYPKGHQVRIGAAFSMTALGDTLFPSLSLSDALMQDFSPTAHFLIRLRVLHPTIAMAVGTYLILIASLTNLRIRKPSNHLFSRALTVLVVLQILAGVINVTLLAPIWMQIIHLFLSDALWITLVLLTATTLVSHETVVEKEPLPGSQLASSSKTG